MARPEDIPQPTRDAVLNLPCPTFDTTPFVSGPPLSQRRIAILSSAALVKRGDPPFPFGSGECRFISADTPTGDLLISHVSINFDRAGWQRDVNVVFRSTGCAKWRRRGDRRRGADPLHRHGLHRPRGDGRRRSIRSPASLRQERIDFLLLSPV